MIVSSVYSWLKDLRSNFDIYDSATTAITDKTTKRSKQQHFGQYNRRRCSCQLSDQEEMFDIPEIETVLLRNDYSRRSVPVKKSSSRNQEFGYHPRNGKRVGGNFAELCIQERAKKAWSVGDVWGLDFQLKGVEVELRGHDASNVEQRRDSELTDVTVKEALDEFSFLSDVDMGPEDEEDIQLASKSEVKINQPVYMNITTIGNTKLQQLQDEMAMRDSRMSNLSNMSLSSTYSFVSCGPSDGTLGSASSSSSLGYSHTQSQSHSPSSGTYTINSLYSDFRMDSKLSIDSTCSGATFQTEDSYSIQDEDDWKKEDWRSLCSLGDSEHKNPLPKPLKKGKSLDSFNLSSILKNVEPEVQLRPKDNLNRRSVIPVMESSEIRKAIIMPKCKTPDQQSTYMNIWECYSKSDKPGTPGFKPVPAPRTKFLKPAPPPKPRQLVPSTPRALSRLEIKKARENIVSFAFDETVEYLKIQDSIHEKDVQDDCERLPPLNVIMWMTELMQECEWEPEYEVSTGYESEIQTQSSPEQPQRKISKRQDAEDMMMGHQSPGISLDTRDNKFDFNNVRKYKMDNQVVKLKQNDVIQKHEGKLLHKNNEGTKTLAENFENCRLEQKSSKEHILILPDQKRINLYSKNAKEKSSPTNSPESVRSAPAKTDMRNRLMQLFKLRPARDTLREKGILKNENVFGNTLVALDFKHNQHVPSLVTTCIEFVELPANIETQGLYRSSASLAILQELRFAINISHGRDLSSLEKYKTSPDVPSGLLKLFIRELKDPLIGMEQFEALYDVCIYDYVMESTHDAIQRIINTLSPPHKDTLEVILKHLVKVISYQEKNDMTIEGISICWGQTMITGGEASDPVMMARRKNEVVELLLRAYNAKDLNDVTSFTSRTVSNTTLNKSDVMSDTTTKEQTKENTAKDIITVNPLPKPSRIPQRQPSVETYMKPKISNVEPVISKSDSKTSIGSNSSLSRNSGSLNFGPSGNYVQELAAKLQMGSFYPLSGRNGMMSLSNSKSLEFLDQMGSTMSLCTENDACLRLRFIKYIIQRIESMHDFKGVYRGKGNKNIVEKLVRKYKKENSKEFKRYLSKADVFILGQVLIEVIKEVGYVIEFYDMQTLIEKKEKYAMKHILDEIPEEFIFLFKHFDNLKKKSDSDLTIMIDVFEAWWPILIGIPDEIDAKKERVGKNQETFDQLIQIVLEISKIKNTIKSASLYDLREIGGDDIEDTTSLTRKISCCNTLDSDKRMTSYYSKERL